VPQVYENELCNSVCVSLNINIGKGISVSTVQQIEDEDNNKHRIDDIPTSHTLESMVVEDEDSNKHHNDGIPTAHTLESMVVDDGYIDTHCNDGIPTAHAFDSMVVDDFDGDTHQNNVIPSARVLPSMVDEDENIDIHRTSGMYTKTGAPIVPGWEKRTREVKGSTKSTDLSIKHICVMRSKVLQDHHALLANTELCWETNAPYDDMVKIYGLEQTTCVWPKTITNNPINTNTSHIWIHGYHMWSTWLYGTDPTQTSEGLTRSTIIHTGIRTWISEGVCPERMSVHCDDTGQIIAGCMKLEGEATVHKTEEYRNNIQQTLKVAIRQCKHTRWKREERLARKITAIPLNDEKREKAVSKVKERNK
jgi:hypothetical protein